MPRKISRKGLVKKLDSLVSKIVVARDKKCVVCGSVERLGCGHLFTRQAYSTRWDLENCNTQCWGCNYRHEYDPYPYTQVMIKKYGQKKVDEIHNRFRQARPIKTHELEELRETLEELLKTYD